MSGRGSKDKNRFTQGGTRNRIYQRKKSFPDSARLESPDGRFEFTDLENVVSSPVTLADLKGKDILSSSEFSKSLLKVPKPMSPNPSESSALMASFLKSSCNSPDHSSGENSFNQKDFERILSPLDPVRLKVENKYLKDLVVSQLDLIQQQSETILSKDKQLKALRMENELLQQRLERRERRRVRGESEVESSRSSLRDSSEAPGKELNTRKRPCVSSSSLPIMNKRIKRENTCDPEDSIPVGLPEKTVKVSEFPRFDDLTDEILEESDDRSRLGEDLTPVELTPAPANIRLSVASETGDTGPEVSETSERKKKNQRKPSTVPPPVLGTFEPLFTPYHYYIGCRNDIINNDDKLNEVAALQLGVEVPKWREDKDYTTRMAKINASTKKNPFLNKYKEGDELLDDVVFLKRHEKPEVAEKRQKKWDIQRLREITYCEKLKARQHGAGRNKKTEPDSLLPMPEAAQRIQISKEGKVPVTAFGEPVPSLEKTYFSLPWLDVKEEKSSVQRRPRHTSL